MIKKIHVDFAPPSWRRWLAELRISYVVCFSLIAGLTFEIALKAYELHEARNALQAQREQLRRVKDLQKQVKSRARPMQVSASQASTVNDAVRKLNVPWEQLFVGLEAAGDGSIGLLSLEADGGRQVLRGIAEARTPDHMLAFIDRLKQARPYDGAALLQHEKVEAHPQKPTRFQFEVRWVQGVR